MSVDLPKRKQNRLVGFDYSQNAAYFITFCVKNNENLLWESRGAHCAPADGMLPLSEIGKITDDAIRQILRKYPMVSVENHVVMPNHVHLLILIHNDFGSALRSPTVSAIVNQLKGYITKQSGVAVWQRSFHDHIIRNEKDYEMIWEYVEANPFKWKEDRYYFGV